MFLPATLMAGLSGIRAAAAGTALLATVFVAVYHAEVVAHRIGEPFGMPVLADGVASGPIGQERSLVL